MEDLFKKGLTDYTPAEDGWNVPSDDLWDNAVPHLPKQKKKKKLGLILFGIVLLAGLVPLYFATSDVSGLTAELKEVEASGVVVSEKAVVKDRGNEKSLSESTRTTEQNKMNTLESTAKKKTSEENLFSSESIVEQKISQQKYLSNPVEDKVPSTNFSDVAINIEAVNSQDKLIPKAGTSHLNIEESAVSVVSDKATVDSLNEKATIGQMSKAKILALSPLKFDEKIPSYAVNDYSLNLILPMYRPSYKQEIGVGHEKYLANLLTLIDFERDMDTINIDGNFKSLNLHYTRWSLNNRWSLSTGVYLADFQLDIFANQSDTIGETTLKRFVSSEVGNQLNQRNIDEACTSFQLMLHAGETVNADDIIRVIGKLDAGLKAVQIPLMIKRHWYREHMEFSIGLGGAIDYVVYEEDIQMMEVEKEGRQITVPYSGYSSYDELSGSILLEFGTNIYLSNHFNIGLKTRFNAIALPFSGVEMGLFYRW